MAGEATVAFNGNLGSDAELKITPTGKSVCQFSVAVTPRVKKNDNWEDGDTVWYRVSLWGRDAENGIEHLLKGTTVVIYGALTQRKYVDKEGKDGFSNDVRADLWGIVPRFDSKAIHKATETAEDDFPW